MPARRSNLTLLVGLLTSVVTHAAVLLPMILATMTAAVRRPALQEQFDSDEVHVREEEPEPPDVALGLEDSKASTLTWVGYEDYEQHIARLAETEQAAFTQTPGETEIPEDAPPPTPIEAPVEEPSESQTEPAPNEPQPAPPTPVMPEEQSAAGGLEVPDAPPEQPTEPAETPGVDGPDVRTVPDATEPRPGGGSPPRPTPDPPAPGSYTDILTRLAAALKQQPREEQEPVEQQPPKPSPTEQITPPTPTTAGVQADASDMESPATSFEVPLQELRPGKPLASEGLELRPQQPRFTRLIQITARWGNPYVEINFGKDGRPRNAAILGSSGDQRVDDAILASLYRWRAKGKSLDALQGDEMLDVRIRILLTQRR